MCGREALEMARAFGFEGAALAPVRGPVAYAPNAEAVRQGIVAQPDALMPGARSVLVLAAPGLWPVTDQYTQLIQPEQSRPFKMRPSISG